MEIWCEVRPGLEVSSLGRVRKYLEGHDNGEGYLCISNGRRGEGRTPIHHLVAEAFLGPRPEGQLVRHLNDKKQENQVENLAYGTRSDNAQDAIRNGHVHWTKRPENKEKVVAWARRGGLWWKGRKREGQRGKAVS